MTPNVRILTLGVVTAVAACSGPDPVEPISTPRGQAGSPSIVAGSGGEAGTSTSAAAGSGTTPKPSTGGTGGNGGNSAGGINGSSGSNGTAGSNTPVDPPRVCKAPQYTHLSGFGSIFDGWSVASNSTSTLRTDMAGGSVVALDASAGSPDEGSIKLSVPFSAPGQQLLLAQPLAGVNLTGTTLTARIKLDSGLNISPENPGQAYLVVKSTASYAYAPAAPVNLDASAGWVTLTLDADAPNSSLPFQYWACDIREIDLVIQTGEMGAYAAAQVHVDTIAVTSKTSGDGRDGEAGAGAGGAAP